MVRQTRHERDGYGWTASLLGREQLRRIDIKTIERTMADEPVGGGALYLRPLVDQRAGDRVYIGHDSLISAFPVSFMSTLNGVLSSRATCPDRECRR